MRYMIIVLILAIISITVGGYGYITKVREREDSAVRCAHVLIQNNQYNSQEDIRRCKELDIQIQKLFTRLASFV